MKTPAKSLSPLARWMTWMSHKSFLKTHTHCLQLIQHKWLPSRTWCDHRCHPFQCFTPYWGQALATLACITTPRPGTANPIGLHRPLNKNLEDKILGGEYVDFTLLLPSSLNQPHVQDIHLLLDDLVPGSSSPLTMVWKRKLTIENFHKWLDAYVAYICWSLSRPTLGDRLNC